MPWEENFNYVLIFFFACEHDMIIKYASGNFVCKILFLVKWWKQKIKFLKCFYKIVFLCFLALPLLIYTLFIWKRSVFTIVKIHNFLNSETLLHYVVKKLNRPVMCQHLSDLTKVVDIICMKTLKLVSSNKGWREGSENKINCVAKC